MASIDHSSQQRAPLESLVREADERFRAGLDQLADWTQQARKILDERPAAALTGFAAAGFVGGMILRNTPDASGARGRVNMEPMLVFLAATLAGFFAGPKVLEFSGGQASHSGSRAQVTSLERH